MLLKRKAMSLHRLFQRVFCTLQGNMTGLPCPQPLHASLQLPVLGQHLVIVLHVPLPGPGPMPGRSLLHEASHQSLASVWCMLSTSPGPSCMCLLAHTQPTSLQGVHRFWISRAFSKIFIKIFKLKILLMRSIMVYFSSSEAIWGWGLVGAGCF